MEVHLIDGTYELFRHFYAVPSRVTENGREVAAYRGVVGNALNLLEAGATHIAVATDHVIESFRNDMWADYKDGSGVDPDLRQQFEPLEAALRALGVGVWPMVDVEADDALAAGAVMAAADNRVERVYICTVDKDLCQCVGGKVVQWDRRKDLIVDRDGVIEKFGVPPESIPDYLGLVGDSADGFPGLSGWGAKSTSQVLARYGHIEDIPLNGGDWDIKVRGAAKLAATLANDLELALLFRRIATVELDSPVGSSIDEFEWTGPRADFADLAVSFEGEALAARAAKLAAKRFG
jgi:5'-3' exonuclease